VRDELSAKKSDRGPIWDEYDPYPRASVEAEPEKK